MPALVSDCLATRSQWARNERSPRRVTEKVSGIPTSSKLLERPSIDKKKIRKANKDEFSPIVALKNIKMARNGQEIKKIHTSAIQRTEGKSSNGSKNKYSDERK